MTTGRIILYCLLLVAGAFAGLTFYPGMFYANSLNARYMVVHSPEPLDMSVAELLGRITDKISADDFFDPGQTFEIYLGTGYGKYALLAPFCGKSFACVHPLTGNVFIASADPQKNLAYYPGDPARTRMLEHVLTHELVKAQLRARLGALKYTFLKDWQTEGYAEHVTLESSDADNSLICPGAPPDPRAFYLKDRLVLEEVKAVNDITYPAIMEGNRSPDQAAKTIMQRYCK